jgi:hypothetical protein
MRLRKQANHLGDQDTAGVVDEFGRTGEACRDDGTPGRGSFYEYEAKPPR